MLEGKKNIKLGRLDIYSREGFAHDRKTTTNVLA